MSHKSQVLSELQSGERITSRSIQNKFGFRRLAAHICQLKKEGNEIVSETINVTTRNGTAWVSEYRMEIE